MSKKSPAEIKNNILEFVSAKSRDVDGWAGATFQEMAAAVGEKPHYVCLALEELVGDGMLIRAGLRYAPSELMRMTLLRVSELREIERLKALRADTLPVSDAAYLRKAVYEAIELAVRRGAGIQSVLPTLKHDRVKFVATYHDTRRQFKADFATERVTLPYPELVKHIARAIVRGATADKP
jgi:hypothetical protein